MLKIGIICYAAVAVVLFLVGITFGKILKKDVLHGGIKLGIINSALLSSLWPITIICMLCGWGYEIVQEWKRL